MVVITWTDSLLLQIPQMDQTHREFVDLLCAVEAALGGDPAVLAARYAEFVNHTQAHFEQEERWMAAIGFDAANCHAFQHSHVLQVLRKVQLRLEDEADVAMVGALVQELTAWLPEHAHSMDEALADTMRACGYDPATGTLARPRAADAPALTGCGGGSCS